jgi:hypothetical protein
MELSPGHFRITRSAIINGSYTNNAAAYIYSSAIHDKF